MKLPVTPLGFYSKTLVGEGRQLGKNEHSVQSSTTAFLQLDMSMFMTTLWSGSCIAARPCSSSSCHSQPPATTASGCCGTRTCSCCALSSQASVGHDITMPACAATEPPPASLHSWSHEFFCRCCRYNCDCVLPFTPRIFPAWPQAKLSQPLRGMRRTPRSE